MRRGVVLVVAVWACGDNMAKVDAPPVSDAPPTMSDAPPIDAPVDAAHTVGDC
jgi:hypothetical protein